MIRPPSTLFLANLSGFHEIIPFASPLSIILIMESNSGRPGDLADFFSTISLTINSFSVLAYALSSDN